MPSRCVVGGCSNTPDLENGVILHTIPYFNDDRPVAKSRRKLWLEFVKRKRAKWTPSASSVICSKHFASDDYTERFNFGSSRHHPQLIRDELGIRPYPRFHNTERQQPKQSNRSRRMILRDVIPLVSPATKSLQVKESRENDLALESGCQVIVEDSVTITVEPLVKDGSTQTKSCVECTGMKEERRKLKNKYISLKTKYNQVNRKANVFISRGLNSESYLYIVILLFCQILVTVGHLHYLYIACFLGVQCDMIYEEKISSESAMEEEYLEDSDEANKTLSAETAMEEDYSDDSDEEENEMESEPCFISDDESEVCDSDVETNIDLETERSPKNLRTEPKHIVFLSKLLLLFQFCHACKADNPLVESRDVGSMVVITTTCQNPRCCKRENIWKSQPQMPGTKIPAGNFLLCFAILLAGGSASKVFQIFSNMGLACITLNTFFEHQRNKLFPSILLHWKKYQAKMIEQLKTLSEPLTISGDARHDSMGHSAKYGAYTIFCCTMPLIIHFSLVQRNEAGSSTAMEMVGFQRCMTYLLGSGLDITTFISDRHLSIAKFMREKFSSITHYFDLWHLKKSIRKAISKIAREGSGEGLKEWIQPCINHLHWSATTTMCGTGKIILAKFKTFLSHVVNKHDNLDDPLFHQCAHGPNIKPRKWLQPESDVYSKLVAALTNKRLVNGIEKASPLSQTSCLEGFHSLLNQFCPKMISYSYPGMYCRHILAAIHFNVNLVRDARKNKNGSIQVRFIYPKFKNGEASVRDVRIKPNFDYVEDIFNTYLEESARPDAFKVVKEELKEMTPLPMNTMLEKEPKEIALQKKMKRKSMVVENVPPTTPLSEVLAQLSSADTARQSTKRKVST